tara:strand:+ start:322 stop:492 length:171 start_codon:yes stop_codon:yes gene_type:complete
LKKLSKIKKEIIIINNMVLDEPVDLGLFFPKKVSDEKKNVYRALGSSMRMKFTKVL